jgi:hypothetical protein
MQPFLFAFFDEFIYHFVFSCHTEFFPRDPLDVCRIVCQFIDNVIERIDGMAMGRDFRVSVHQFPVLIIDSLFAEKEKERPDEKRCQKDEQCDSFFFHALLSK